MLCSHEILLYRGSIGRSGLAVSGSTGEVNAGDVVSDPESFEERGAGFWFLSLPLCQQFPTTGADSKAAQPRRVIQRLFFTIRSPFSTEPNPT